MGLAAASHFIVNVGVCQKLRSNFVRHRLTPISSPQITEAGPSAFATIEQNYYYVFVGCTLFFLTMAYLYFPETKGKTLEQIAAAFGDQVVTLSENDVVAEQTVFDEKAGNTDHREND